MRKFTVLYIHKLKSISHVLKFTHHALIALFFALSLFSCEKEYLFGEPELQNHRIEQRSDTSTLIQQIAEDSSFIRLFQLSTVDNYVLQAYIDNQLDTTDIWLLFDELGIDYSGPVLTVQHDNIGFVDYGDLIDFVENEYADSSMVQYFEEIRQSWNTFSHDKGATLDALDHQYLEYVLSQAFGILLDDHQQIFQDMIAFRTNDECEECIKHSKEAYISAVQSTYYIWSHLTFDALLIGLVIVFFICQFNSESRCGKTVTKSKTKKTWILSGFR